MRNIIKKLDSILPRKLIYCDVGARWGIEQPWELFRHLLDLVSFEPDQEEFQRLKKSQNKKDKVYPYALSKEPGNLSLYLTKSRGCSSLYKPNQDFLKNYSDSERFNIEDVATIEGTSLKCLHKKNELLDMDFIKLDVQGAELDVLQGGGDFLSRNILGLQVEVEFQSMYQKQPLFSDIDPFIRNSLGLSMQDLRKTYWKYPEGIHVGASKGKLIFGDVLYFRDPFVILEWCSHFSKNEAAEKIAMACLLGIVYGYLDYSLCLLNQPAIHDFLEPEIVNRWKSLIFNYGKTFQYRVHWKFASLINVLYRVFQPTYEGWASVGHHLGSRKKFGVFT